jgi:hypothetical protein
MAGRELGEECEQVSLDQAARGDNILISIRVAFKARVEKMSSIDGEYRLLGRLGGETENVFNEYGSGPEDAVQIVGGGRQDVEFIDGLRFSVLSDQNMTMNVNFFSPIPPGLIPAGMTSLCKCYFCICIIA